MASIADHPYFSVVLQPRIRAQPKSFSRFLELPPELRAEVLSHVLLSSDSEHTYYDYGSLVIHRSWAAECLYPLLSTSKQMRQEAIDVMPQQIAVASTSALLHYLQFMASARRLGSIQKINIDFLHEFHIWDAANVMGAAPLLQKCRNLKLHVFFEGFFEQRMGPVSGSDVFSSDDESISLPMAIIQDIPNKALRHIPFYKLPFAKEIILLMRFAHEVSWDDEWLDRYINSAEE